MSYSSQDPYQREDSHGGVPHRADSDSDSSGASTSPQTGSRSLPSQWVQDDVRSWTNSSGQPQFSDTSYGTAPNWGSPPSAPYNTPSNHRQQRVQPYTSTQSQFNPPGQEPTSGYYRQPDYDYLPPGASSDRPGSYDRTHLPQPQPQPTQYDTEFATQTQHRSPSFQDRQFQDRQQDYRTSQQQYSAQYSQQHAQQAYPPRRHLQQQQYSAQYPQQRAYPPPHSQQQQYSPQYLQQQHDRTYYSGRVAAMPMEPHGGANYTAAGGSYPSGGYPNVNYQSFPPPGLQAAEGPGSRIYEDEADVDYPDWIPGSTPVGGLIRCRCGATYPPHRSCPYCSR